MTQKLLVFDDVVKRFGGITAVDHNSFSIEEGKIVALIGPNGAGKTSTFNCITGTYQPDQGYVIFAGQSLRNLKPYEIADLGLTRTFQNLQIFTNMNVIENVMVSIKENRPGIFSSMFRLPFVVKREEEAYQFAMEKLKDVGLEDKAFLSAGELSFGEQRLLEIARALAVKPRLLMLDEPMAGMSRKEVGEMKDLILRLKNEMNLTIFLIEHDMETVMELSDHIIVLEFGQKIAEGTPEAIQKNQRVQEAYLGLEVHGTLEKAKINRDLPALLSVENIETMRGGIKVLQNVSIQVHSHELVTIIGANGAGKSTLLGSIVGQFPITSGSIKLRKEKISGLSTEKTVTKGLSLVPERRGMFPELTVEESLHLGAYKSYQWYGAGKDIRRKIQEDMEEMFELFPRLKERRTQLAGTLSGGEQQMLAIARGLMAHPKILLLDEPSLGLAPQIVDEIFSFLYELKQKGTTILLVEQNARAALHIADRAYVLEKGRIVYSGDADELMKDSRITEAYLGGF